jgi:hypothetical protein
MDSEVNEEQQDASGAGDPAVVYRRMSRALAALSDEALDTAALCGSYARIVHLRTPKIEEQGKALAARVEKVWESITTVAGEMELLDRAAGRNAEPRGGERHDGDSQQVRKGNKRA